MLTPGEPIARTQTEEEFQRSLLDIGKSEDTYTHSVRDIARFYAHSDDEGKIKEMERMFHEDWSDVQLKTVRYNYEKDKRQKERYGDASTLCGVCQEIKDTEKSFRDALLFGVGLVRDNLIAKHGELESLLPPYTAFAETHAFESSSPDAAFRMAEEAKTYDDILLEISKDMLDHMQKTKDSFAVGVGNRSEFVTFCEKHKDEISKIDSDLSTRVGKSFTALEPSIVLVQRVIRYRLLLDEMIKKAEVLRDKNPGAIKETTITELKARFSVVSAFCIEMNNVELLGIQQEETAEIFSKRGISRMPDPNLSGEKRQKIRESVASVIKSGKPDDIQRVLSECGFAEAVTEKNPTGAITLEMAGAIKQDFYRSQMDPNLVEQIQAIEKGGTPIFIHAIDTSRVYKSTTLHYIEELNKEYEKASKTTDPKEQKKSLDRVEGLLVKLMPKDRFKAEGQVKPEDQAKVLAHNMRTKIMGTITLAQAAEASKAESLALEAAMQQEKPQKQALAAALVGDLKGMEEGLKEIESHLKKVGFSGQQAKTACDEIKASTIMQGIIENATSTENKNFLDALVTYHREPQKITGYLMDMKSNLQKLGFNDEQIQKAYKDSLTRIGKHFESWLGISSSEAQKFCVEIDASVAKKTGELRHSATVPAIPGVKVVPPAVPTTPYPPVSRANPKPPAPAPGSLRGNPPGVNTSPPPRSPLPLLKHPLGWPNAGVSHRPPPPPTPVKKAMGQQQPKPEPEHLKMG